MSSWCHGPGGCFGAGATRIHITTVSALSSLVTLLLPGTVRCFWWSCSSCCSYCFSCSCCSCCLRFCCSCSCSCCFSGCCCCCLPCCVICPYLHFRLFGTTGMGGWEDYFITCFITFFGMHSAALAQPGASLRSGSGAEFGWVVSPAPRQRGLGMHGN